MFRVDEVIARKEVSIVLDDRNITTGLPKDTERMLLSEGSSSRLFEYLYLDLPDILAHPLVEDGAEEISKSFSGHSAKANATLSVRLLFNEGQKLHIFGLDLLEEPVNLGWILNVLSMHHAQYIARDPVLPQEFIPMHRLFVGGLLTLGDTVPIVHLLRTI